MQKRTNPLELKLEVKQTPQAVNETVETKPEPTPVAVEEPVVLSEAVPVQNAVQEEMSVPAMETASDKETLPTEEQPEKESATKQTVGASKKAPAEQGETRKRAAKKETPRQVQPTVIEADDRTTIGASADVRWQRVVPQTAAPAAEETPVVVPPLPEQPAPTPQASASATYFRPVEEEAEPEQDTYEEPILEEEYEQLVATDEQETDDEASTGECIDDEQAALVLEDYEMSARFALRGRVSRGMKMAKISRDVCRLAQLMHPDQSLSTILENALLTRIYLENRDAFDAMADMIEKKGGRIKC